MPGWRIAKCTVFSNFAESLVDCKKQGTQIIKCPEIMFFYLVLFLENMIKLNNGIFPYRLARSRTDALRTSCGTPGTSATEPVRKHGMDTVIT